MLKNDLTLGVMILFSPAKINLGLQVLRRRPDGYHQIRTVMYPVGLCDILEIKEIEQSKKAPNKYFLRICSSRFVVFL